MPLKITGAALLALSGFASGYFLSKRLRTREKFLSCFILFLNTLSTEIRFSGEDIFTLVSRSTDLFIIPDKKYNEPFESLWDKATAPLKSKFALTNKDTRLIKEFGQKLGGTDAQGQLSHISLYLGLFEVQHKNSIEEIKNKSKVYQALGIFAGLSLAIVLV